ncbi:MAG: hypothetical protein AAFN10_13690 [Bacteroidota bacterium]
MAILISACTPTEVPPPPPESYFLALITPPEGLPIDFEGDEGVGDFNASSGLLRLQATSLLNGRDKIELTIRKAKTGVLGTYNIGPFGEASTNVRAEFIDGYNEWSARSLSGTLEITQFEATENGSAYWLSGTFAFEAAAQNEKIVAISYGESQRSAILAE